MKKYTEQPELFLNVLLHKKKQGVPWIAFRFRHGFRLRLSTEREISTGKHNDRRYSQLRYLSNHFRIYSIVVQF